MDILIQQTLGVQKYEVMYHKIIAANIKKLRKQRGMSQENFAEKIDCSREFVSRMENTREKPSLKMLLKLSYLFSVEPVYFFKKK